MHESPETHFNTSSEEEPELRIDHWPQISEHQLAYLDAIGGYYRGFVEGSGGRRYEDIWRDVKAAYELFDSKLIKVVVETRAYGRGALQDESQVEGYTVSITFEPDSGGIQTLKFDINERAVSMPNTGLHALADAIHHYIVHDLNTLPRTKSRVQREIQDLIDKWKTRRGYFSEDFPDIHNSGSSDRIDGPDASR